MINDAAYQCVNAAKRGQIVAPGHFKTRSPRGSVSLENACERARAENKTREDYLARARDNRESLLASQLNRADMHTR